MDEREDEANGDEGEFAIEENEEEEEEEEEE